MDLNFVAYIHSRSSPVMARILLQIFAEICPTASDTHHDSFAVFAYEPDEELDGRFACGAGEMVELDLRVAALRAWSGGGLAKSGSEGK